MMSFKANRWQIGILTATLFALTACASGGARSAYRRAEAASERDLWDEAVLSYAKAAALDPTNTRYKVALERARLRASSLHFDRGKKYLASGQLELAFEELQEAVVLDPSNQYASVELGKAQTQLTRKQKGPSEMEKAQAEAARRAAELGPPRLNPASNVPLVLRFPDASVEDVLDAMSKGSGINILYDDKVDKKKKVSIELANVTFEKAMDILMLQYNLFYKVIDAHTILIAEDNRQKHSEYDDNVIRTFYLSNAETKDVQTLLRGLLESRRIAENADLNAITIKDTPEKIKVAERIIKANDKAKGEVVVDLELLEINRSNTQKLGLDLSSKALSLAFGDGKQAVPLNNLARLNDQANWLLGPIPSVVLDFLKSDSDSKSIARPSVRILEGESGKITIGDRVPIPATTFNTSQTVGTSIIPVTSFTYQNVGIIVEIKPRVHHNKEITLELKLEVSSLAGSIAGTGGVSQPIIGTRSVETHLRLKDGETNILAGLVKDEERVSLSGIPGLSDVPLLRRLFGSTQTERSNNDIVLSITPHIIRTPNIEPIDLVPLWVGTEETIELRGVARNALGESPFASNDNPWTDIDKELNGESENADGGSKAPQVKVSTPPSEKPPAATPSKPGPPGSPTEQRPPRQPRKPPTEGAPAAPAPPTPAPSGPSVQPISTEGGDEGAQDDDEESGSEQGAPAAQPKPPVSTAQIRIVPEKLSMPVGDPVGVNLLVTGAENVGQVNFQLRFNPQVLKFVPPAEPGDFMAQGGISPDIQVVEGGDGATLVVSLTRTGTTGAGGSGKLVRLNFLSLAPGTASFGFAAAAVRDPNANSLPAAFRVSNIEVTP